MLNENGQRELVYVVEIDGIQPIEGADRVELAIVGGWHIMVQKNQFQPGDLAVYFEIDSKVPAREPFLFLAEKRYRIKTQKYFKGTVISQGLLMTAEDFGWNIIRDKENRPIEIGGHKKGDFLTEEFGVTYVDPEDNIRKASSVNKYKRMAARHPKLFRNALIRWIYRHDWGKKLLFAVLGRKKDSKSDWPAWVVKTDEERIQNVPGILADKSEWIATEKIDGTSTTATLHQHGGKGHEYYVCSRNVVFRPDDRKNCPDADSNVYIEMAQKYKFEEVLGTLVDRYHLDWVTLQGETYGEGIQKRDYGKKEHDFMGFNLIFSDRGRLNSKEAEEIMKEFQIPWVPILDEHFILPDTVDELLEIATGTSKVDGGMREGLVFRSQDGKRSFKAVSNEFLLKYHS